MGGLRIEQPLWLALRNVIVDAYHYKIFYDSIRCVFQREVLLCECRLRIWWGILYILFINKRCEETGMFVL